MRTVPFQLLSQLLTVVISPSQAMNGFFVFDTVRFQKTLPMLVDCRVLNQAVDIYGRVPVLFLKASLEMGPDMVPQVFPRIEAAHTETTGPDLLYERIDRIAIDRLTWLAVVRLGVVVHHPVQPTRSKQALAVRMGANALEFGLMHVAAMSDPFAASRELFNAINAWEWGFVMPGTQDQPELCGTKDSCEFAYLRGISLMSRVIRDTNTHLEQRAD